MLTPRVGFPFLTPWPKWTTEQFYFCECLGAGANSSLCWRHRSRPSAPFPEVQVNTRHELLNDCIQRVYYLESDRFYPCSSNDLIVCDGRDRRSIMVQIYWATKPEVSILSSIFM